MRVPVRLILLGVFASIVLVSRGGGTAPLPPTLAPLPFDAGFRMSDIILDAEPQAFDEIAIDGRTRAAIARLLAMLDTPLNTGSDDPRWFAADTLAYDAPVMDRALLMAAAMPERADLAEFLGLPPMNPYAGATLTAGQGYADSQRRFQTGRAGQFFGGSAGGFVGGGFLPAAYVADAAGDGGALDSSGVMTVAAPGPGIPPAVPTFPRSGAGTDTDDDPVSTSGRVTPPGLSIAPGQQQVEKEANANTSVPVPEPSTLLLLAVGATALAGARRRSKAVRT